ncbi:DUF748 domain-containing protein [Brumimicrobium aurantiacum]|uniref:DUF748 domain-containing protein n=1 Tax=Brumimicrobium aurantiacum TaxID=1737063 RepID=A0A3E1EZ86_9FLAO|nr:DUF748 domain-containing protein [Brumimicrobium aurantiacum]RFC54881.1 DUF748 domain-containing protein [Brumimicrobium aurantiacum]
MSRIKNLLLPTNRKRRTLRIVLYSIILILVAFRIYLPFLLKDKLVAAVNEVEGYECTLGDLDLSIIRGAMVLQEFEIKVTENSVTKPFVYCKNADISIEWNAIFHGSIVSEVILEQLELYFADGKSEDEEQTGGTSWVEPIIDFIPLKINRFVINNGQIEFENMVAEPPVNLKLTELQLKVENLTNSTDLEEKLPSSLELTSKVLNKGNLHVNGGLNILKDLPDMDLNLDVKDVDLTELNEFTQAYANFDFEKGNFGLATEFAMLNGEVKGYVKPILQDVKVLNIKEDVPVLNTFWQAVVGLVFNITKNIPKDKTGTKIPISGNIDNPDVELGTTIVNIFRNAFVEAYKVKVDNTISLKDIANEQDEKTFWEKFKGLFTNDNDEEQ